jgi:phosphoglycerate dehydrogenase-like enzyme
MLILTRYVSNHDKHDKQKSLFVVFQKSIFINVGRGDVVDEQSIVNAIKYDSN